MSKRISSLLRFLLVHNIDDRPTHPTGYNVQINEALQTLLAETTGGDMHSTLTALETWIVANGLKESDEPIVMTLEMTEKVNKKEGTRLQRRGFHV